MRLHYLQHVSFETPGSIREWAAMRGHSVSASFLFDSAVFPDPENLDLLVIMGGPMSVHDEKKYPWLIAEKKFIEECLAKGKKILGICLGAQLLAEVCGGRVTGNPEKEIGYFPVRFSSAALAGALFRDFPEELNVFHWHGETFSLPEGAIELGASVGCSKQGFLLQDQVLALQFHPELTVELAEAMIKGGWEAFVPGPYIQEPETIRLIAAEQTQRCKPFFFRLLDRFFPSLSV